jgi:hypothetical protein
MRAFADGSTRGTRHHYASQTLFVWYMQALSTPMSSPKNMGCVLHTPVVSSIVFQYVVVHFPRLKTSLVFAIHQP